MKPRHTIISSSLGVLKLDTEDKKLYEAEAKELFKKFYRRTRAKYGIWAGNQGKFVKSRTELNDWDGDFEEREYAADLGDVT